MWARGKKTKSYWVAGNARVGREVLIKRVLALIVKEFLALLKDKKGRMTIIIPPLIQLIVFGYAATFDLEQAPIAVFNEDAGAASRELVARFTASSGFKVVRHLSSDSQIAPLVDSRQVLMVLHLGPRCSDGLLGGSGCTLQVIIDGRNSNTAMISLNYVRDIVTAFNEQWIRDHGGVSPPARLNLRAWFNPNLESRWFIVPGIVALLALVVTLVVTSLSVAREREAGTFDQLLVTPLRPIEILVGKAVPGLVIGLFEGTLIITLAVLWFSVPLRGNLAALYLGLAIYVLAAIGVGLMISSMCTTQQQALLGAFVFLVPAVTLSGFSTPIANMPAAVQTITLADPMRYFLVIVRRAFLEGAGLADFWSQIWPIAIIATITLSLAVWFFRHRMY